MHAYQFKEHLGSPEPHEIFNHGHRISPHGREGTGTSFEPLLAASKHEVDMCDPASGKRARGWPEADSRSSGCCGRRPYAASEAMTCVKGLV